MTYVKCFVLCLKEEGPTDVIALYFGRPAFRNRHFVICRGGGGGLGGQVPPRRIIFIPDMRGRALAYPPSINHHPRGGMGWAMSAPKAPQAPHVPRCAAFNPPFAIFSHALEIMDTEFVASLTDLCLVGSCGWSRVVRTAPQIPLFFSPPSGHVFKKTKSQQSNFTKKKKKATNRHKDNNAPR